jgi:hypothetical protein
VDLAQLYRRRAARSWLRRALEPPAPFVMNPREPRDFPLGRWNLYIGGAGRSVPGYVNLDLFPMIDGSDQNTCPAGVEVRNVHSDRRDTVLIGVRMKDQRPKARTEQFHHDLCAVNNPSTTAAANHHGHIGLCTAAKNIVADKLETEFRILGPVLTSQIADDADRVEREDD